MTEGLATVSKYYFTNKNDKVRAKYFQEYYIRIIKQYPTLFLGLLFSLPVGGVVSGRTILLLGIGS